MQLLRGFELCLTGGKQNLLKERNYQEKQTKFQEVETDGERKQNYDKVIIERMQRLVSFQR